MRGCAACMCVRIIPTETTKKPEESSQAFRYIALIKNSWEHGAVSLTKAITPMFLEGSITTGLIEISNLSTFYIVYDPYFCFVNPKK